MPMGNFGKFLRYIRESKGATLKNLADAMGWSVVYLSDIERGRRNPPADEHLHKIAQTLEVSFWDLKRKAMEDRALVELEVKDRSDLVAEAAFVLARGWDGLTDQEAIEIMNLLKSRKGDYKDER